MRPVKSLDELRKYISEAVGDGIPRLRKKYTYQPPTGERYGLTGYIDSRTCLVFNPEHGIRCCDRSEKVNGDTEIMVLRKPCLMDGGLKDKAWDRVLVKCATYLEKQNLYNRGKKITDKTGLLWREREENKKTKDEKSS